MPDRLAEPEGGLVAAGEGVGGHGCVVVVISASFRFFVDIGFVSVGGGFSIG